MWDAAYCFANEPTSIIFEVMALLESRAAVNNAAITPEDNTNPEKLSTDSLRGRDAGSEGSRNPHSFHICSGSCRMCQTQSFPA